VNFQHVKMKSFSVSEGDNRIDSGHISYVFV